ncbi:crustapain-like [Schistocerca gregaria]|uniref:crustapain-like n=1 Tax=Schistocerca gregaria TaxID=7010 RepID=UPI00211E9257|nr:crustapain-like [Schistocerca gregaria]
MSIISDAIFLSFICLLLNNFEPTNAKSFPIWPKNVSYRVEFEKITWPLSIPVDVTIIRSLNKTDFYYSVYDQLNMYYSLGNSSFFIYPRVNKRICDKKLEPFFGMVDYLPDTSLDWNHIMEKDGLDYWSSTTASLYNHLTKTTILISRASDNTPVLLQSSSGYPFNVHYFFPIRISYSNFKTDNLTIIGPPNICNSIPTLGAKPEYPHITFLLKELGGMINGISYEDVTYHYEFSNFISKHSKSYIDKEEYNLRLEIFKKNLQIINEHNKRTDTSYSLGITKFADMSGEELRILYSNYGLEDESETKNMLKKAEIHKRSMKILPKYFNWIEEGVVSPIKDQGPCGSCWVFNSVSALESAWAIKTGTLYSLSEQQIINCVPLNKSACSGGPFALIYDWLPKFGTSFERSYPYLAVDGYCEYKYDSPVKLEKYVTVEENAFDIMDALVNHGPLVSGICVDRLEMFVLYIGGIYDPKLYVDNENCFRHAINIVGYGTDILPDGSDGHYWLMRNSWGPYWGIKGYFKFARNIEDDGSIKPYIRHSIYPVVK